MLPHRMERVGLIEKVEFINDSAATMPDATIAALEALAGRRIIHVLGGNDKKLDFNEWAEMEAAADIKLLLWLPGNASKKMAEAYTKAGGKAKQKAIKTMIEAVAIARSLAESGDVVLLSPGATSFGSYKNEFDRGNQFRAAVQSI
jgi:UDP-N-acetylmuramoylalanine--D-glutamate ligase